MEWVDVLEQDGYTDKDVAKLIAAVHLHEMHLRSIISTCKPSIVTDDTFGMGMCAAYEHVSEVADKMLVQLQSGEFGEGE